MCDRGVSGSTSGTIGNGNGIDLWDQVFVNEGTRRQRTEHFTPNILRDEDSSIVYI